MNNLILIGNGFDLAHGLKTSYNHFIEWLVNEHCKDGEFAKEFLSLPDFVIDYTTLVNKYQSGELDVHGAFKNQLIFSLIKDLSLINWCDIESKYFGLLIGIGKNVKFNTKKLNESFEILKNYLHNYLKEQEQYAKPIESYSNLFSTLDSPHTLILNFNYTHTVENLYGAEIKEGKIIHMHGELDSVDNPIVFGYAADHDEARELLNKNDKEYLRNIKKHLYKRADNEFRLLKYLTNTKDIDVSILGHSCGLSDKLILNQILNSENVLSIRYFYYKEYEFYFEAIVNIDRIMKRDEEFRERIINFKKSFRMPQYDDYTNDLEKFVNYIQDISIDQETRYNTKYKDLITFSR